MRKEADYAVTDRIQLSISGKGSELIIASFGGMISRETLSTSASIVTPDIERNEIIDEGMNLILQIKK